MKTLLLTFLSFCTFASAFSCGGKNTPPTRQVITAKELIATRKPAIVRIESSKGVATGFAISNDGKIVTNLHVVQGSPELQVVFSDGSKKEVKRVLSYRREYDLAILKVEGETADFLSLGNSDKVSSGDKVIAIGNPFGVFDYTVSDGLISAVRDMGGRRILQTTAPISVGSSGGPVFNEYGEVIGIATFIAQGGQNLNFAIPSNYLRKMLLDKRPLTTASFFDQTKDVERKTGRVVHPEVERNIPSYDVSILKNCSDEQIRDTFIGIQEAIDLGAPVYNRGEYEACFVVYRNAAQRISPATCPDLRKALKKGIRNAEIEEDSANKAWALRDAFDGILVAIHKKATEEGIELPR